jgi:hypothetical protein
VSFDAEAIGRSGDGFEAVNHDGTVVLKDGRAELR